MDLRYWPSVGKTTRVVLVGCLVLGLVGCGSPERDSDPRPWEHASTFGGASPSDDEPAEPDARLVTFEVQASGSADPIVAEVPENGGAISVQKYPTRLQLPLLYGLLPVGFEGGFSEAFCASISELLNAGDSAQVRDRGAVGARVTLSSLVGAQSQADVLRAGGDAANGHSVYHPSPLQLEHVELELQLEPDALSHTLGDEAALLAPFQKSLERYGQLALTTGELDVSVAAKDLWCDLAEGRASLSIQVSGSFGDQAYEGTTTITGVEPL